VGFSPGGAYDVWARVIAQGGQKRHPSCLMFQRSVWELLDKHKISEVTGRLAKVLFAPDDLGRPLFGPPGVPTDRVKVLREAFMKMMNDPDVLTDA
jgi:tripartite-type tricarboxylate transporter receptor subunit TctC